MKTSSLIITSLALSATAVAFLINAETAIALLAATGVVIIAVTDYSARRVSISGLTV